MRRRLVKITPPPADDLGLDHISRYMTQNGFAFACGKCGAIATVSMPADDLAPVFKSFITAHGHEVSK
jgi:hypothetical protein